MSEQTEVTKAKGPALPAPAPFARWRRIFAFPFIKGVCWLTFKFFGRLRSIGGERVPRTGGLLVFPNHRSDCDPPVMHAVSVRPMHFMAKSELFEMPLTAWAMWLSEAFPVRRGEPDRAALRHAAELAKLGEAVCIFPEGQLTETGKLQEIKAGVALIVRMAGVPCICLGLRNTEQVVPYGTLKPHFSKDRVEAVWGEPRTFDKSASAEEITGWIESELRRLSGEE
jgi:1-acyl-sn-glycerol-3-phosphate acyltransferase